MKHLILIILCFTSLGACKLIDKDVPIRLINDTARPLKVDFGYNFPDTAITGQVAFLTDLGANATAEKEPGIYDQWKGVINSIPGKKLSIFFFDADTVNKYDWRDVKGKYMIAGRKDLTYQELVNANMEVHYP